MSTRLRRLIHRLQGQTSYYQYYATVHSATCEACLGHHGKIYSDLSPAPQVPLHPDCRCTLLEFPAEELESYQERGLRMKKKAERELRRRRLFHQACKVLSRSSDEAFALFEQSAQLDLYLEEIESLCRLEKDTLRASPELALRLRDLFLQAYKSKFDGEKYQPMPEGMKSAQRMHGLYLIQTLFQTYTTHSGGASSC